MPATTAVNLLLAPDEPTHATCFLPKLLGMLRGTVKNVGNAYTGIPRSSHPLGAAPASASGWASYAFRASLRAQAAEQEARRAMRAAARHELIAQASAEQSRAALHQAEQLPKSASVQQSALRPFVKFCGEVATFLSSNPDRAAEPSVERLRSFCGGLDAHLDRHLRKGSSWAADIGLSYYDAPPKEYPHDPIWPPAVPTFRAPPQELPPAVPADAGSPPESAGLLRSFL
mmetsp:Transcript_16824/g.48063  ORF Transcript_16824/g.48063 Transcript_16824/m.48063 type:complete len:230 (+) Transcript_16824:47-736(+)